MTRRWPLTPPGPNDGTPILEAVPASTGTVQIPAGAIFMPHLPLTGAIDGVNKIFQAPVAFISGDIVREVVYRNGVRVASDAYTADPVARTITFTEPPQPSDMLLLDAYVETTR